MKQSKRPRLPLAEKLQVLHYHSIGMKPVQIQSKFKISPRTFYRILESEENLRELDSNGESVYSKGTPHPKHPELESRVTEFVAFARNNRMPVSKSLIEERAVMTAEMLGITVFKASNGWLERYLRRSSIQPPYKLRGKGNAILPPCHTSRMVEIRSTASQYEPCNIWNLNESGLFFSNETQPFVLAYFRISNGSTRN